MTVNSKNTHQTYFRIAFMDTCFRKRRNRLLFPSILFSFGPYRVVGSFIHSVYLSFLPFSSTRLFYHHTDVNKRA